MIYRLHELLRFLGLKDGLFEQPGDSSSDSTVGAVNDQTLTQSTTGSTSMKLTAPQNSTERLSKDLKRAARLHIAAGQHAVDSAFSTCKPYVDLAQVVPLSHTFDAGEAVVPLRLWDGTRQPRVRCCNLCKPVFQWARAAGCISGRSWAIRSAPGGQGCEGRGLLSPRPKVERLPTPCGPRASRSCASGRW